MKDNLKKIIKENLQSPEWIDDILDYLENKYGGIFEVTTIFNDPPHEVYEIGNDTREFYVYSSIKEFNKAVNHRVNQLINNFVDEYTQTHPKLDYMYDVITRNFNRLFITAVDKIEIVEDVVITNDLIQYDDSYAQILNYMENGHL